MLVGVVYLPLFLLSFLLVVGRHRWLVCWWRKSSSIFIIIVHHHRSVGPRRRENRSSSSSPPPTRKTKNDETEDLTSSAIPIVYSRYCTQKSKPQKVRYCTVLKAEMFWRSVSHFFVVVCYQPVSSQQSATLQQPTTNKKQQLN